MGEKLIKISTYVLDPSFKLDIEWILFDDLLFLLPLMFQGRRLGTKVPRSLHDVLRDVRVDVPGIKYLSNVTGQFLTQHTCNGYIKLSMNIFTINGLKPFISNGNYF